MVINKEHSILRLKIYLIKFENEKTSKTKRIQHNFRLFSFIFISFD